MKKVIVCAITIIAFMSCQTEEQTVETPITKTDAFSNWMKADLTTVISEREMNYSITNEKLLRLSSIEHATQIRFIPGVINEKLIITVAAVNETTGEVIAEERIEQRANVSVLSTVLNSKNNYVNINQVNDLKAKEHALSYSELSNYLKGWNTKSNSNLEDYTSYNGERLHYVAFSPEVIRYIANANGAFTTISWGLDKNQKMTTVFTPALTNSSKPFLGFNSGKPCPPYCSTGGLGGGN